MLYVFAFLLRFSYFQEHYAAKEQGEVKHFSQTFSS